MLLVGDTRHTGVTGSRGARVVLGESSELRNVWCEVLREEQDMLLLVMLRKDGDELSLVMGQREGWMGLDDGTKGKCLGPGEDTGAGRIGWKNHGKDHG